MNSIEGMLSYSSSFIEETKLKISDNKDKCNTTNNDSRDSNIIGVLFEWYEGWMERLERSLSHACQALNFFNTNNNSTKRNDDSEDSSSKNSWAVAMEIGMGWVNVGVLQVMLFRLDGGMLDPVREVAVKKEAVEEQVG